MPKKHIRVAVGVIENDRGELLIAQRAKQKHQGGCWEFPGGKIEAGESSMGALKRELAEELCVQVREASPLCDLTHEYPDIIVTLDVWRVTAFQGLAQGNEGQPIRWIKRSSLKSIVFPEANQEIVERLLEL